MILLKTKSVIFLSFYLKANSANVSPPLSTILGNEGLQALKFCKEFNVLTEVLPTYFSLKVFLLINRTNRSWDIKLGDLNMPFILNLISIKMEKGIKGSGGLKFLEVFGLNLISLYLVSLFFFKNIKVKYIWTLLGIVNSSSLGIKL